MPSKLWKKYFLSRIISQKNYQLSAGEIERYIRTTRSQTTILIMHSLSGNDEVCTPSTQENKLRTRKLSRKQATQQERGKRT